MENATPTHCQMDPHVMLAYEACEDRPADRELYLSIAKSLKFAALGTELDIYIAFSIGTLSRCNVLPLQIHLTAAKRVLRYLVATKSKGLYYPVIHTSSEGHCLQGYDGGLLRPGYNFAL